MDWINVKDRLPELFREVLGFYEYGGYEVVSRDVADSDDGLGHWSTSDHVISVPSHWMPLPPAPHVEELK